MPEPVVELRGVGRSYSLDGGARLDVLRGVNLRIEAGEFLAVMGPSGSGKSTLLQILGLLDRPSRGSYRLLGRDVSGLSDDEGAALRSREIGFVFQMFNLLARTSARENAALPLVYAGVPRAARLARAEALLGAVGLGDRLGHHPRQLSGGQQQRVAVARALANAPRIIFADEPTGNLASEQAEEVLGILAALNRAGITVVMVTHEPDIAACARRVVRVKDGEIVEDRSNSAPRALPGPALALPPAFPPGRASWAELREHGRFAARALSANALRSALSTLGILIGAASVVALLALGRGAQDSVERSLSSLGSNLLTLRPFSPRGAGGARGGSGSFSRLTLEDVEAIRAVPGIRRAAGEVYGQVQAVQRDKNASVEVNGVSPEHAELRGARVYHGRFFTAKEEAEGARVALLGQTSADKLFGTEDPVGAAVKLDRVRFRVIGVLERKGASAFRDQDDVVLVPLRTAMKRLLGRPHLSAIVMECASPEAMPEATAAVRRLVRKRHRLPDWRDDDFDLRDMAEIRQALSGTSRTFGLLIALVGGIAMVVGGIGIMNIMLVSVSERTREIGLRKAVGASRAAVLAQFLIESAAVSILGGLLGVLLGAAVAWGLGRFAGWAAAVSAGSVLLALSFSAAVGVLFGYWPARKASRLSPIEALRYE